MTINEATQLIEKAVPVIRPTSDWADLGCGTGLFSSALATYLPETGVIYAVDTDKNALAKLPQHQWVEIVPQHMDFKKNSWPFNNLDGILMANSLHYVSGKSKFIQQIQPYLKPNHHFLIVEYERVLPNPWVPFPITFNKLSGLFQKLGYQKAEKLGEHPSSYGGGNMYAALIQK